MAKTTLEEFVTVLGFDVETEDGKRYVEVLNTVSVGMKRVVLGATAAAAAIGLYTRSVARSTDASFKFANSIGVGFEEMQRLTFAMEIFGTTAETTKGILGGIAGIISGLEFAQGPHEELSILGVDIKGKDPIKAFELIARALERKPKSERLRLGAAFGFSIETMNAIDNGFERIIEQMELAKRIGGEKTDPQGLMSEAFEDRLLAINEVFKAIGNVIAFKIQPVFNRFAGDFVEWFIAAKESGKLAKAFDLMEASLRPLAILLGTIGAFLLASFVVANAPLALAVIALGLLAVAVDDVKTHFEGGESAIGDYIDQLKRLAKVLGVDDELRQLWQSLVGLSGMEPDDPRNLRGLVERTMRESAEQAAFNLEFAMGVPGRNISNTNTVNAPVTINGNADPAMFKFTFEELLEDASITRLGPVER